MLQISSMMLVWMIGIEIEAQLCANLPKFGITIVASSFVYASILHCFSWFHVQSCSIIPQDQESSNGNGFDVKKFEENLREFFLRVLDLDLKVVVNAENS